MKKVILYLTAFCMIFLVSCDQNSKESSSNKQVRDSNEKKASAKITMEEKMMDIDGQTIYFKEYSDGTKDKPALLMLHGYGGSSDGFSAIYDHLSKRFTIVSVDVLGFGRSSKPSDFIYTFPNEANLYYKLMTKLGFEEFAVMGHSMGGEIALNIANLYPDAVTELVLIDAIGVETLTEETDIAIPEVDNSLSDTSAAVPYDAAQVKHQDEPGYDIALNKMWHTLPEISASRINMPTLIVWGEDDPEVPLTDGEQFAEMLPSSKLKVIKGGNHAPFRKQTDEFLQSVDDFFNGLEKSST